MVAPRKNTSEGDSEADLRRRTDKEWRHEDHALTATYSVCRMIAPIQAAFIPVTGTMIGDDPCLCAKVMFVVIVVLSLLSIAGAISVPVMLAGYHRYSSWYYGITGSGTVYPPDFDEKENEKARQEKRKTFDYWNPKIVLFGTLSLATTSILFCIIVAQR